MSSFFCCLLPPGVLERDYILCLRAFLAVSDSELDFLAVGQSLESVALDRAEMHKDVRAIFTLDKAETLGLVKPLNSAGCCRHIFYLYCLRCHVQAPFHLIIIYG